MFKVLPVQVNLLSITILIELCVCFRDFGHQVRKHIVALRLHFLFFNLLNLIICIAVGSITLLLLLLKDKICWLLLINKSLVLTCRDLVHRRVAMRQ